MLWIMLLWTPVEKFLFEHLFSILGGGVGIYLEVELPGPIETLGEGNGNPLQYSCLENPMDGGAW